MTYHPRRAHMMAMAANGFSTAYSIPADYLENGRLYHGYHKEIYMFPCDEAEKERMDIFHKLFLVARNDALHRLPVADTHHTRILDLGTGTGIWAIDMADKYKRAEVVGMDLANIQPRHIPANLSFRVPRNFDGPWSLGQDSFDLIHLRQGCGSVQSWPELYQKIYSHLKPGIGVLEQVEIDFEPRCDDDTLPSSPVREWYGLLKEATMRAHRPIEYQKNTRQLLEQAGFVDVQERVIRLPYNTWPADPKAREIGKWYGTALPLYLEALSLAPFTRIFHWNPDDVKAIVKRVGDAVVTRKCHAYNNVHVWTARRSA